jgi:phosphomannomutase
MYILDKLAMVASTVSSKMIETIAEVEGFKFKECLTGEFCSLSLV